MITNRVLNSRNINYYRNRIKNLEISNYIFLVIIDCIEMSFRTEDLGISIKNDSNVSIL